MIISDACTINVARVVNHASKVTLQIVASLTIVIYDCNIVFLDRALKYIQLG